MKIVKKFWPQIFIAAVIFVFLIRLFFPPSTFITPDFGRSDILHSNLPAKLILEKNLKNGSLPLWDNRIGQGYPVLAEGIAGTFYIQNLLIFSTLPFEIAIPVNYLVTFLISATAMYLLAKKLKAQNAPALLAALAYSFCASMMLHVQHINFIQSASLLPLILLAILHFFEKPDFTKGLLVSFLYSQLFFAGFIQIFTYSVIVFFVFVIIHFSLTLKKNILKTAIFYAQIITFSLALAAAQLFPSYELIKLSDRTTGVQSSKILDAFPLFPRNFLTYLNPFILGSADNGTYNSTDWSRNGIYWENTAYIGFLPLMLALISILTITIKRPKNIFSSLTIVLAITILLSLGRQSPLHVLFSFPPLNYFRVPSRFILFTQLFASLLIVYQLRNLNFKKSSAKILVTAMILITLADIFINWQNYNPILKTETLFKNPQTREYLNQKDNYRVFSIAAPRNWNEIFTKSGWRGKEDYYVFFLNALDQNINVLYNVSQASMFETLPTRRYQLLQSTIKNNIKISESKITIENLAKNLLDVINVKYLISSLPIEGAYSQIGSTKKENFSYFVYESQDSKQKVSFYNDFKTVSTIGDYLETFKDLDFQKTLVLEKDPGIKPEKGENKITVLKDQAGYLQLEAQTETEAILAISQTYYPGWQAKIDGSYTEIIPANITSQAISVPKGAHIIEFVYNPKSFKIGSIISLASYALLLLFTARKLIKSHW